MSSRSDEALRFVLAKPLGTSVWISGYGQSMWPLFRTSDAFRVRRCAEDGVRPGDLVLVKNEAGELVLHVAVSASPLRTAGMLAEPDPEGVVVLGRVERVRRGIVELPVPRLARPVLRTAQRAASAAYAAPPIRRAARGARELFGSRATLPVRRRWLGEVEIRALGPDDWTPLFAFAGDHLRVSAAFLRTQLHGRWRERGAAIGALARGRMVGFCWVDEYRQEQFDVDGVFIRSLFVRPIARGMGVGRGLVERACAAARAAGVDRVYADVEVTNEASLRVFRALGFGRASPRLEAAINDEWRVRGRDFELHVLEKTLA